MFSVHPQYYYDNDGFYRALAAQRARERREAEYRARLQEARYKQQFQDALRKKAYQDYLAREQRRRSMYSFISGFDSDEEYSDPPYSSYVEPFHEPIGRFQKRDFPDDLKRQRVEINDEQESRQTTSHCNYKNNNKIFPECPSESTPQSSTTDRSSESPRHTTPLSTRSPPKFDPRDRAARKIQYFFRTNLPRYKSLKAISSVADEFEKVVANFVFPSVLDFADSDSDAVKLLYTSRNTPVHLHEHTLLNFLSRLDSIDSHGDERVRVERKNLVKEIERELEKLDTRKIEAWRASRVSGATNGVASTPLTTVESIPEPDDAVIGTADQDVVEMECSEEPSEPSSNVLTLEEKISPIDGATNDEVLPMEDTTYLGVEEQIDVDKQLDHDVTVSSDSMHPDSDDVLSAWEVVPGVGISNVPAEGVEINQQQMEVNADDEMVEYEPDHISIGESSAEAKKTLSLSASFMGAGQSSNEKVVYNETPISFSQDLVNHLADSQASSETTPAQQSVLDAHVRERIQNEIARLRTEEEDVKREIEMALERENIDKERLVAVGSDDDSSDGGESDGDEKPDGVFRSSDSLRADLENIQKKVERFHRGSSLEDVPDVKESKERLVECYRSNTSTSLNCWREVTDFKESVQRAERKYLETLQ